MDKQFEFLMYRSAEEDVSVNAVIKDETIWLTQKGMAELFNVDKMAQAIVKGIMDTLPSIK